MSRPSLKVIRSEQLAQIHALPPAATFTAAATLGAAYQVGGVNRCPHCSGTAFNVGRVTAECGACGNPLPIAPTRQILNHPTEERI